MRTESSPRRLPLVVPVWLVLALVSALPGSLTSPLRAEEGAPKRVEGMQVPDVPVVDQDGRALHFYSDLVQGKTVALNFVFTTCRTVCPPMGANFAKLRQLLAERSGGEVSLISVSVDPATDTPQRMKEWGEKFGAGPGWTLVTGEREPITRLLKALGVFSGDKANHSPLVLIGNDRTHRWTRTYGLTPPAELAAAIDEIGTRDAKTKTGALDEIRIDGRPAAHKSLGYVTVSSPTEPSPAHKYFGDVKLIDQDGREQRLYSDLLQGQSVVIDVVFTSCHSACPAMSGTFARIQEHLGDRLGKDVRLLSISIDPENDTPAKLKEYAARFKARPGWYFLTGTKSNVEEALRKLGQYVEDKEDHLNLFLIGNEKTGLWKKAFGLASPEQLFPLVDSVIDDGAKG